MKQKTPFEQFSIAVHAQFELMKQHQLFTKDVGKDDLWRTYLDSFPEGTNEIFRTNTEHDCNCCSQFIKRIGNVVAIIDGEITSVWDVEIGYPYDEVAAAMRQRVMSTEIRSKFFYNQKKISQAQTISGDADEILKFNHFYCELPNSAFSHDYVGKIGTSKGDAQTLRRALDELTIDALEQVSELIESNSIYRGAEFKNAVSGMTQAKRKYAALEDDEARDIFVWSNASDYSLSKFRNSVIGTLVVDISDGESLESSVAKYETKVAPANYKRPKSLITESMIKSAMNDVTELGLRESLNRRHATIEDVSVNDILFVDKSFEPLMKDSLVDSLMDEAKPKAKPKSVPNEITIEEFLTRVVPEATEIELFFDSMLKSNLVSLTGPSNEDAAPLFKWQSPFAWSYNGGAADSIKQKVKAAGGNIQADLRVSLSWSNYDDLDIHMDEPSGNHIYYGNMSGKLDVDMNAGGRKSRDPVENIAINGVKRGTYKVSVNNFTLRETIDVGFCVEIEHKGVVTKIFSDTSPSDNQTWEVAALQLDEKGELLIETLDSRVTSTATPVQEWGVLTESFQKVSTIMLSPNHWGFDSTGNKHWFFVLDGCKNPEPTRGIYNEFLRGELAPHRKVFEILAQKTKCEYSDNQLSGLGFSETLPAKILVKVDGKPTTITINQ